MYHWFLGQCVAPALVIAALAVLASESVSSQEALQPGESFVTRFSGTTTKDGRTIIDTAGTVGSIIDLRAPGRAPQGQHWINEPHRLPVTAAQVGQVFGVALDDATPRHVYLSATSAFGLHRNADNTDWMAGMWGPEGGPGTVYKLSAANNYQPEIFANITLDGRANTGAALGNIAYGRWNKQLYISDLETGMIHRLAISDGRELGTYDHGMHGRARFMDAVTGAQTSLAKVAFDTKSKARIKNCPDGDFAKTPACWNLADFRRRVWGVGVRRDAATGDVRLYYAVWSSQGFGNKAFVGAPDQEKRNSVWSVSVAQDGSFDTTSIRREFFLPDFFTDAADIARAGRSHPVSDIAFDKTGDQDVMLLAERGGVRNLDLGARAPFARPHESRVLRYEVDAKGVWQPLGRYDVGFYDREKHGGPYVRANSAGGVDFGFGYDQKGAMETTQAGEVVWMTGDALCDADGPCTDPATGKHDDTSEVHGLQGLPVTAYEKVAPDAALKPYPATGLPYPPNGPDKAYMIDVDRNVDASGTSIATELARNDATKVGDVEVFGPVAPPAVAAPPGYPPAVTPGYPPPVTPPGYPGYPPSAPPGPVGPDLAITKEAQSAQCELGQPCIFTIKLTNKGQSTYEGPVFFYDQKPKGKTFSTYTPSPDLSGGSLTPYGPPVGTPWEFYDWVFYYKNVKLSPGQSVTTLSPEITFWALPSPTGIVENCVEIFWPLQAKTKLKKAKITAVQRALSKAGHKMSYPRGQWGAKDTAELKKYQKSNGLPVTGVIDAKTLQFLFPGITLSGDQNPKNDKDCAKATLKKPPKFDLMIKKEAEQAECEVFSGGAKGKGNCWFQITIANIGSQTYSHQLHVRDRVYDSSGKGSKNWWVTKDPFSKWKCKQQSFDLDCKQSGPLKPGETRRFSLNFDLGETLQGTVKNCAELIFGKGKEDTPNDNNDSDCATVTLKKGKPKPQPKHNFDLMVEKTEKSGSNTCEIGGDCEFIIKITNKGSIPYKGPLFIHEKIVPGAPWSYQPPQSPWKCRPWAGPQESNCSTPSVTLAPNASITIDREYSLRNLKDPSAKSITNCASIYWPVKHSILAVETLLNQLGYITGSVDGAMDPQTSAAILQYQKDKELLRTGQIDKELLESLFPGTSGKPGDDNANNDKSCATVQLTKKKQKTSLNLGAQGPTECRPPNCSFYEFTVTNDGERDYSAPMSLRITLPAGVRLLEAKGSKSAKSCSASAWSCSGSGDAIECRPSACALQPGEQTAVGVDLRLLPDTPTAIPPGGITKTICGDLKWFAPKEEGFDIEQVGDERHSRACVTTRILPPKVAPEVEAKEADLGLKKSGPAGCDAGGHCLYEITVTNHGPGVYDGPLTVTDEAPQGWKLYGGFPSPPWACPKAGDTVQCRIENAELVPGDPFRLGLEFRVPPKEGAAPAKVKNCAALMWPSAAPDGERDAIKAVQRALNKLGYKAGPADGKLGRQARAAITRYQRDKGLPQTGAVDDALMRSLIGGQAKVSGDPNPKNDRACVTTSITGPPEERPPEPPSPEEAPPKPAPPEEGPPPAAPPDITPPSKQPVVCPEGQHWDRTLGRCVCPQGQRWDDGQRRCVPREVKCPPGQSRNRAGQCVCPQGQRWDREHRRCVPREVKCPPGQSRNRAGQCVCPQGQRWDDGQKRCVPRLKPLPIQPLPKLQPMPACPLGTEWHAPSQQCIKPPG